MGSAPVGQNQMSIATGLFFLLVAMYKVIHLLSSLECYNIPFHSVQETNVPLQWSNIALFRHQKGKPIAVLLNYFSDM